MGILSSCRDWTLLLRRSLWTGRTGRHPAVSSKEELTASFTFNSLCCHSHHSLPRLSRVYSENPLHILPVAPTANLIGVLAPSIVWSGLCWRFKTAVNLQQPPVDVTAPVVAQTWKSSRNLCQQGQGNVPAVLLSFNSAAPGGSWITTDAFPVLSLAWKRLVIVYSVCTQLDS